MHSGEMDADIGVLSCVSKDILCDVLRRAFGLTRHLEAYYQKLAYKFHKTRNDAQILAEDLCYQLSLLEKNIHPYYNPNAFLSRRSYDMWRLSSRRQIMDLLNKFWCSPMLPIGDVAKFDAAAIHLDYKLVLHKLLRQQRQRCNDASTVAITSIPSSATQKILTEFSLRYGIDELYQQAAYLEYLTLNFSIEVAFLELVIKTIQNILGLLPSEKCTALLVKQQVVQLQSCVDLLLKRCEHLFSHIQTVFISSNSSNCVGLLIHLLEEVLSLQHYLDNDRAKTTMSGQLLQQYLEVNFQLIYIDQKTSALSDVASTGQTGHRMSPQVINRIMSCLRDDLKDYRNNYQALFEKYLNITELASIALYDFLMDDVTELCEQLVLENGAKKVNFAMIGLTYRLNDFDHESKDYVPLHKQTWRLAYARHIVQWLSAIYHQVELFLLSSIAQDLFVPIKFATFTPSDLSMNANMCNVPLEAAACAPSFVPSRLSAFSRVTTSPHQSAPGNKILASQTQDVMPNNEVQVGDLTIPPVSFTNIHSGVQYTDGTESQDIHQAAFLVPAEEVLIHKQMPSAAFQLSQSHNNTKAEAACCIAELPDLGDSAASAASNMPASRCSDTPCSTDPVSCSLHTSAADDLSSDTPTAGDSIHISDALHVSIDSPVLRESVPVSDETVSCSESALSVRNDVIAESKNGAHKSNSSFPNSLNLSFIPNKSPTSSNISNGSAAEMLHCLSASVSKIANTDAEIQGKVAEVFSKLEREDNENLKESELKVSTDEANEREAMAPGQNEIEVIKDQNEIEENKDQYEIEESKTQNEIEESKAQNEIEESKSQNEIEATKDQNEIEQTKDHDEIESTKNQKKIEETRHSSSEAWLAEAISIELATDFKSWEISHDNASMQTQSAAQENENSSVSSDEEIKDNDTHVPRLKLVGLLTESTVVDSNHVDQPGPVHLLNTGFSSFNDLSSTVPVISRIGQLLSSSNHDRMNALGNKKILITSSVVSVICLLQRLIHVVETLGGTLCLPECSSQGVQENVDREMENKMTEIKNDLQNRLQEMIHSLVSLYVKNLLAMDLCALSETTAVRLTGNQLVEDVKKSRSTIWGCRHKFSGSDCLQYFDRDEEFRENRYEPLTKEMCLRINNLQQLRQTLRIFYKKSSDLWSSCSTSSTSISVPHFESRTDFLPSVTEKYVDDTISGLVNILVHRFQLFVTDFITRLVISNLPSRDELEKTLEPLKQFLTNHLMLLKSWLYKENYTIFLDRFWLSMSWCFEKIALDLRHNPNTSSEMLAECLLQTVAIVLRIVSSMCSVPDQMNVQHLDTVLYWLQLYLQPTDRLISIYWLLCLKETIGNLDEPLNDGLNGVMLDKMRRDLHSSRKCFQGQELMDWIARHPQAFAEAEDQCLSNDVGRESNEWSSQNGCCSPFDISQKLLDTGVILPVGGASLSSCYSSTLSTYLEPYPRLVFCGTVQQVFQSGTESSASVKPDDLHSSNEHSASNSGMNLLQQNMNNSALSSTNAIDGFGDRSTPTGDARQPEISPDGFLNSTPTSVEESLSNFNIVCWYQMPSPEETAMAIDANNFGSFSSEPTWQLRQCLRFFKGKRVTREAVLSVLAARKKHDQLSRQFIDLLPRDVIHRYSWLYVREQTILACLGIHEIND